MKTSRPDRTGSTAPHEGKAEKRAKWSKVKGETGLYKREDGGYYIDFIHRGIRHSESGGKDIETARTLLYTLRSKTRLSGHGIKDNSCKLSRLYKLYIARCEQHLKRSTVARYKESFVRIWEFFKCERVEDLRPELVTEYIKHRRSAARAPSDVTIRGELGLLKSMLNFGEREGSVAENPLKRAESLKARKKYTKRALTREEFEKLINHEHRNGSRCGPSKSSRPCNCKDLWLMLGETGMRKGEFIALRWDDVDLQRRVVTVRGHDDDEGPKTAASWRKIPMSDRVHRMLTARAANRVGDRVFVNSKARSVGGNLRRKLKTCLKAAGIDSKGVCLHSMRYSFATWLIQSGVSPKTVQKLLGHRDVSMTLSVYAQVLPGDEEKAMDVFKAPAAQARSPNQTATQPSQQPQQDLQAN